LLTTKIPVAERTNFHKRSGPFCENEVFKLGFCQNRKLAGEVLTDTVAVRSSSLREESNEEDVSLRGEVVFSILQN
jgi:hypothetical protein